MSRGSEVSTERSRMDDAQFRPLDRPWHQDHTVATFRWIMRLHTKRDRADTEIMSTGNDGRMKTNLNEESPSVEVVTGEPHAVHMPGGPMIEKPRSMALGPVIEHDTEGGA